MEGGFDPYYSEPNLAEVVEKRIKDGKDLNKPIDDKKPAPLLVSSYSDEHIAITRRLLELGANPNILQFKDTPLHHAVSKLSVATVQALLEHNAIPDVAGFMGYTPLHRAVFLGSSFELEDLKKRKEIAQLLLEKADPNKKDLFGETPLFTLLQTYNPYTNPIKRSKRTRYLSKLKEIIQLLVGHKTDISITNNEGKRLAKKPEKPVILKFLSLPSMLSKNSSKWQNSLLLLYY